MWYLLYKTVFILQQQNALCCEFRANAKSPGFIFFIIGLLKRFFKLTLFAFCLEKYCVPLYGSAPQILNSQSSGFLTKLCFLRRNFQLLVGDHT